MLQAEGNVLLFIQEYMRNGILTTFFIFITTLGNGGAVWIASAVAALCFKKTRKAGIAIGVALLLSLIINNFILKNLVARIRPYDVIEGLEILIARPKDFSFPSGHTGSSFAAATVIYRCLGKRYGVPAVILAILIGFSRLYIGVHYPLDVLAGVVIGYVIGYFVSKYYFSFAKLVKV